MTISKKWLYAGAVVALLLLGQLGWFLADKVDGYVQRRVREGIGAYHTQLMQLLRPPGQGVPGPPGPPATPPHQGKPSGG